MAGWAADYADYMMFDLRRRPNPRVITCGSWKCPGGLILAAAGWCWHLRLRPSRRAALGWSWLPTLLHWIGEPKHLDLLGHLVEYFWGGTVVAVRRQVMPPGDVHPERSAGRPGPKRHEPRSCRGDHSTPA